MSGTTDAVVFQFVPSPRAPFEFQATLDGDTYIVTILWNVYRAGWYMNVTTLSGDLVFSRALTASPPDYLISMTAGYFTSPIVFLEASQQFVVGL